MNNPCNHLTQLTVAVLVLGGVLTAPANPVISSINPPTLTERVGDHVAFAATATGTGTLTYQWAFGGTNLAGQITNTLILTNIQATNTGTYWVTVGDSSGNYVSNSVTLHVTTNIYLPFYPSNLVVLRVGDGAQPLSTNGNTIYLDQYGTNGTYVSTIQIPDEAPGKPYGTGETGTSTVGSTAGSPALLMQGISGDAANAGYLTLSGNGQYLCMIGYCLPYPYTYGPGSQDISDVPSLTAYFRGCATVNTFSHYSLPYTNSEFDSATGHTVRSMASPDGATFFFDTGQASANGVKFAQSTIANGTVLDYCSSTAAGDRLVQILKNGDLAFSDTFTIYMVSPAPTAYGDITTTSTPALTTLLSEGSSPTDFAFSPDYLTLYIGDSKSFTGTGNQAGGIERWDTTTPLSGYSFSYTLQPLPGASTNGVQGLAVYFPSNVASWGPNVLGAVVYATTTGLTNTSPTNSLVQIIDSGASSVATVLVTAGTNQYLHGLRFAPTGSVPVSFTSQPASQSAFDLGTATFSASAAGTAPIFYQWESNGVAIAGATNSTLVLTNVQFSYAASYSVMVSNLVPSSLTSTNAVLTVLPGAPLIEVPAQSRVETVGDHLAFTVTAGGALPLSYQWYFGANAIPGATNLYVVVTNAQVTNSGTYSVIVTNSLGKVTNAATLLITTGLQALSSANLVMARIGDGSQPLSYTTGNTVYLDQYTPAGAYVNTIQIPDQLPKALILSGSNSDAIYEGFLTLSANSNYLNLAGFNAAFPATISLSAYTRALAAVDANGFFILAATDDGIYLAALNGTEQIHSLWSTDGLTNFWTTGTATSDGVKYIPSAIASEGGYYNLTSPATTCHVLGIDPLGNVAFTASAAALNTGLNVFSGLAETTGAADYSVIYSGPNASPEDFAISPDYTTVYMADDSGTANAGIQRWDLVSGSWSNSYTLPSGSPGGASGLTVIFPTNSGVNGTYGFGTTGATLYATTAGASNNSLIVIVDNGSNSTPTVLATAGPNQILRGLRFGPLGAPPSIAIEPQPEEVISNGTAHFSVAGGGPPPFAYQWQFDGTNIAGATGSSLTVPDVGAANVGSYTVVVSDNAGSVTSTPASLTLTVPPTAPYPVAVMNDHPEAFWRLDETSGSTAFDIIGGFDGIYTPTVELGLLPGYNSTTDPNEPTAFFGNGSDSQVGSIPLDLATNGYAEFSVEAWINTQASLTTGNIIGTDPNNIFPGEFFLGCSASESGGTAPGGLIFYVFSTSDGSYNPNYIASGYVPDGNWHHVVGVCDQSNSVMSLYVDGALYESGSFTGSGIYEPLTFPTPMAIGGISGDGGQFDGEISQVALYNYALSSNQVKNHFLAAGFPPNGLQIPATLWADVGQNVTISSTLVGGSTPLSYQWASNSVPLSWATNTTLVLSNVPGPGVYTYTLTVSNAFGTIEDSTILTTYAGAPQILTDIEPLNATNGVDSVQVFSAAIAGSLPLSLQWQFNGTNLVDGPGVSGAQTLTLTLSDLQLGEAGNYQLLASNSSGTNATSVASLTVESYWSYVPNNWTVNMDQALDGGGTFNGNELTLTEDYTGQIMSVFWNTPQNINDFYSTWTYQETPGTEGPATGFALVLQNSAAGPSALMLEDEYYADLGYVGMTNSVALAFGIWPGYYLGTAFGSNGVMSLDYAPTGALNMASGDPIGMTVLYAGGLLTLTLTDAVAAVSFTTNYTINIPAVVGGNTAYVGFNAATSGGPASLQQVSDFVFEPLSSIPPTYLQVPATVSADAGQTVTIDSTLGAGTAPLSYQWFSNSVPLSWATNAALVLTNVPGPNTFTYTLVVTNAYGMAQGSTILNVYAGAPQIISDIQPLSVTDGVGGTQVFSATIGGTYPLSLQWQFNGTNLSDGGNISGSHTSTLTLTNLQLGEAGNYQLLASNSSGTNATSVASLAVVPLGFEAPSGWTLNGNGGSFSGNTLTLTEAAEEETMSAYWNTPQNIGDFVASWTYQQTTGATGTPSDGWCFVLQNAGLTALGETINGIGYEGIGNSFAVAFNIYSPFGLGMNFCTNGVYDNVENSPIGEVNLVSGDPIGMTLTYLGGVLSLTLTDAVANVSFATNLTVSIPAIVGGNTAYVGFTAATGLNYSLQVVSNFTFINLPTLTAQKAGGGTLILTWPAGESAVLQQNSSLAGANWVNASVTPAVVNGVEQVTITNSGTAQFYRLSVPIP